MGCWDWIRSSDEPWSKKPRNTVAAATNDQQCSPATQPRSISAPDQLQQPQQPEQGLNLSASRRGSPQDLKIFTYAELKTVTRNFYRGSLLGEGGFGCVYKGVIKQGSEDARLEVAVKQLNQKSGQGQKEWLTEVHYLGLADHPNLVKLIGYCSEDDSRGSQRLLVYEFMPNKSLDNHLFSRLYLPLSWHSRIKIALGAARGLAYLHEELVPQVIFRDFKSSNILLDNDFNSKLSDFGLARDGPEQDRSHVSTQVVGTVGYAAPEYVQTGHLTSKSDVWSFGIVILELLTGRKSMDKNKPKGEQRLIDWVRPFIRDGKKFPQLIDPRLEGAYPMKAAHKLAILASQCLQKYPRMRPKMSEVATSLEEIMKISGDIPSGSSCPPVSFVSDDGFPGRVPGRSSPSLWRKLTKSW